MGDHYLQHGYDCFRRSLTAASITPFLRVNKKRIRTNTAQTASAACGCKQETSESEQGANNWAKIASEVDRGQTSLKQKQRTFYPVVGNPGIERTNYEKNQNRTRESQLSNLYPHVELRGITDNLASLASATVSTFAALVCGPSPLREAIQDKPPHASTPFASYLLA